MAKTLISDIIIPSIFENYALERTAAKSAFVQSGIVELNPHFDALASGGGKTIDMPFWQDISPTRQVLSDSGTLAVNKITASKDVAIINNDAQAWGANDLAGALAGSDPLNALLELVVSACAAVLPASPPCPDESRT